MATSTLIITKMNERQRETLNRWAAEYCCFDIASEATLNDCFNSYIHYTTVDQKELALSKKGFSKEFKAFLIPKIEEGKLQVTRKSHIIFKGLGLKTQ